VVLDLALFNITLTSILRDTSSLHKRMTRAWPISRKECKKVTRMSLVSVRMWKGPYGSKRDWLCQRENLSRRRLDEAHMLRYSIQPGSTKMYHDLRQQFWWTRMKSDTALYVSKYDPCRKVKAYYMKPGGLLQPLSIPEWKWDDISMDFIMGLPLMAHKIDSIWVIVDRLSKSAHFILVNTNYSAQKYAEIFIV
jgi:hypothetical protein